MLPLGCGGPTARNLATLDPFKIADSLRDEGRFAEMLPRYRVLRDSFAQAGDTANLWRAQLWWSEALIRNQRRDSARTALTDALTLAGGDPDREGWTRWRSCALFSSLGNADSALAECTRAIALASTAADPALEAEAYDQLGTVQSRRGHYRTARDASERAVVLWRQNGASPGRLSNSLNNLAVEYRNLGRLSEANHAAREGLALARQARNLRIQFFLMGNLAEVGAETGELDQAERLMQEVLDAAESFPDTGVMVAANNSLAEFYLRVGNARLARGHLEEAFRMGERVAAFSRLATYYDLGLLELAESRPDAASQWLTTTLVIADSLDYGRQRVLARTGLSRVALHNGKADAALRWAESALRIADSLGDLRAQLDAMQARAIGELFRDAGADLLLGRDATLAHWRALNPARYRYLHFAAHALVSDHRAEMTGLVLADADLNLAAIRRLTLRSELVTLSACETALGRRVRGEGVIGLPHAFLSAGARSVLVTLWRVADRSTAAFMHDFYQEVRDGQSPTDALFTVQQRWLRAGGQRAHPFYWAPFVLVGGVSR